MARDGEPSLTKAPISATRASTVQAAFEDLTGPRADPLRARSEQLVLLHRFEDDGDVLRRSVRAAFHVLGVGRPSPRGPDELVALRRKDRRLGGHVLDRVVARHSGGAWVVVPRKGAVDSNRVPVRQ